MKQQPTEAASKLPGMMQKIVSHSLLTQSKTTFGWTWHSRINCFLSHRQRCGEGEHTSLPTGGWCRTEKSLHSAAGFMYTNQRNRLLTELVWDVALHQDTKLNSNDLNVLNLLRDWAWRSMVCVAVAVLRLCYWHVLCLHLQLCVGDGDGEWEGQADKQRQWQDGLIIDFCISPARTDAKSIISPAIFVSLFTPPKPHVSTRSR